MALSSKQRGVLKGICAGSAIIAVVIAAAMLTDPVRLPAEVSTADRISFALQVDVVIALWLAASIGLVADHRFSTPEDIDGSGLMAGTPRAQVLQANLQNTLEQSVLAVLAHLAWAVTMPIGWMWVIPAGAALFVLGRVLFLRGYPRGAPARALGFTLTFVPTVLMLAVVSARLIIGLATQPQ